MFSFRSFLGLASYYRCFIKGFASIARPLTNILKGDNGKIGANHSKKVKLELTNEQRKSFEKLRNILESEDVMLAYPDFTQPFDLTTDASGSGLGAVLSQKSHPITMISRTLRGTEISMASNERELLAIVWALQNLRNYGVKKWRKEIKHLHRPYTTDRFNVG